MLGDLREEYRRWIRPERGELGARLWYWGQVVRSVAPTLARRRFRRRLGSGVGRRREAFLNQDGRMTKMETLWQDLRYAVRTLIARPLYAVTAILTLGVGIGGTSAVTSVIRDTLLRPLPYPEAHELVAFWLPLGWSEAEFLHLRPHVDGFEAVAAWGRDEMTSRAGGETARVVSGVRASAELFRTLGVSARRGRVFQEGDDAPGAEPVVVVSHGFWQQELGGRHDVLGATLVLDGLSRRVVGVMPEEFRFPDEGARLWLPLELNADDHVGRLSLLGRLPDGRSPDAMDAELRVITGALGEAFTYDDPEWDRTEGAHLTPLREELLGDIRTPLLLVLGAVGLILAIACANLAAMTLARTLGRRTDLAVRSALGAGRGRLLRQLVTESLVLAVVAGGVGVLLATAARPVLTGMLPTAAVGVMDQGVDRALLGSALGLALAAGLVVGLIPAWSVLRKGVQGGPVTPGPDSGAGPGQGRLERALVVGEVALAVLLVSGAGLLLRSVEELRAIDPGLRADGLVAVDVVLGEADFGAPARGDVLERLRRRLSALPGVSSASAIQKLPLRGRGWTFGFVVEGRPDDEVFAYYRLVEPDYFRTMGTPVLRGRSFTAADGPDAEPAVVVNETFARTHWPGEDAVGKRVTTGVDSRWATVIGVVQDVRVARLTDAAEPTRYQLYRQMGMVPQGATLVIRTGGDEATLLEAARAAVHDVDPRIAVAGVVRMESVLDRALGRTGEIVGLVTLLGAMALLLGGIGVYGVLSHFVSSRTREWGIRMALGQRPGRIVGLVLERGVRLVVLGAALGVAASLMGARGLESLVYGVGVHDPVTFAGTVAVLVGAGALAALAPALRASRVDPARSLRRE